MKSSVCGVCLFVVLVLWKVRYSSFLSLRLLVDRPHNVVSFEAGQPRRLLCQAHGHCYCRAMDPRSPCSADLCDVWDLTGVPGLLEYVEDDSEYVRVSWVSETSPFMISISTPRLHKCVTLPSIALVWPLSAYTQ